MIDVGIGLMSGRRLTTRTFTGSALGGFSSSNKLISAAGQVIDFKPGRTLWIVLQTLGTVATTTETILACASGTFGSGKGFWITRAGTASGGSASRLFLLSPASHVADFGVANNPPTNGIAVVCVKWRASDNAVFVSLNGGPFSSVGTCAFTAPDSSCVSYLGGPEAGLGSIALTSARVLAAAVWSTEATAAEAQGVTFTTGNRYSLPTSVTGSAFCTFDFLASRDFTNGASSVTTLGSSPVTFAVSGSPTLFAVSERRYVANSSRYLDSKRSEAQTTGSGYRFTRRDSFARMRVTTDALSVGVETSSTMYATFAAQATIGLYKNSTYVSQTSILQDSLPQTLDLSPGAGSAKAVDVWEGEQNMTNGTDRVGTFVQAVRVPLLLADGVTSTNTSLPTITPPQKRLVLVGDSIITGFFATTPMQDSLTPLLRADYPTSGTGGVTCLAAGTESINNSAGDQAKADATAALIVSMCDGTASNTIWLQLGTNDYGYGPMMTSAATFQASYNRLISAIIAAAIAAGIPGLAIYCQSPIQRIAPASEAANLNGSTLPNFRTSISTVAAAYPTYCTYVEGGGGAIVSNANMFVSDGIHVISAGFAQIKATIKTTVGY